MRFSLCWWNGRYFSSILVSLVVLQALKDLRTGNLNRHTFSSVPYCEIEKEPLQASVSHFFQSLCLWFWWSAQWAGLSDGWCWSEFGCRLVLNNAWMMAAEGLSSSVQSAQPLCPSVHRLAIVLRHVSAWQGSRSQPLYLITVASPPHRLLSLCPRFSWVLSLRMSSLCVCLWWGEREHFPPLCWHEYCFWYFILLWVWGKVPLLFILMCYFLK